MGSVFDLKDIGCYVDDDCYCFAVVLLGLFGILLAAAFLLLLVDLLVDTLTLSLRLVRPTERELFLLWHLMFSFAV